VLVTDTDVNGYLYLTSDRSEQAEAALQVLGAFPGIAVELGAFSAQQSGPAPESQLLEHTHGS
jgi:hypothetical protein